DFLKAIADGSRIAMAHLNKDVVSVPEYAWPETAGIAADEMPTLVLLAKEFKGEKGLIFALFSMRRTFDSVLKTDGVRGVRLQVFSKDRGLSLLRYDSAPEEAVRSDGLSVDLPFVRGKMVDGREWVLRVMPTETFNEAFRSRSPMLIALIGTLLSLLVFLVLLLLVYIAKQSQMRLTSSLHDRERRLEIFLERVPVAIAMFDREMRILAHSDRWIETTGLREEMLGRNYFDAIPDERVNNPNRREHMVRALAGEEIEVEKAEYTKPDGEKLYVHYRIHPWQDMGGKVQGAILFVEDITDIYKATEKLKRTNQELEQFAYIASHDLKAPLRGIDNLAKLIEEDIGDQLPGDSREKLNLLRGRVHRLEMLLEGILKY